MRGLPDAPRCRGGRPGDQHEDGLVRGRHDGVQGGDYDRSGLPGTSLVSDHFSVRDGETDHPS
ncbi:hypothetical protein [Streptomyces sp. NPDC007088]|uniref:hypothetical protein n=1 Tax=Streptomyces sp. NPDC007088 TaxID=3364773 RepID=UPI00368539AD